MRCFWLGGLAHANPALGSAVYGKAKQLLRHSLIIRLNMNCCNHSAKTNRQFRLGPAVRADVLLPPYESVYLKMRGGLFADLSMIQWTSWLLQVCASPPHLMDPGWCLLPSPRINTFCGNPQARLIELEWLRCCVFLKRMFTVKVKWL